jgi:molybdenum cofactor cytidylyltransferase
VIPAVVLAAGKSTRMGRTKATLPLGSSDTFLTRIIRTFHEAGADDVLVVIGHEAAQVEESVSSRGLPARFIVNRDYENGQLSSVLSGLNAIDKPGVRGFLLTLVDVPLVSAQTVRRVIEHYRRTAAPIVRPVRGSLHGHPVLIDRSLFHLLRSADPAAGIKPVVRAHASRSGDMEIDDEGSFIDVDTPEDYLRVTARLEAPH